MKAKRLTTLRNALAAPWALHPGYLPMVMDGLVRYSQLDDDEGPVEQEPPELDDLVAGHVAVLPLQGVLLQHPGQAGCCGPVTFTEWWAEAFKQLLLDDEVAAVVIDADTPGGIIYGTPELSDLIHGARGTKPVLTVSNSLMASAGYWVGTAADEVFITPGGDLGSVGVYAMHVDISKALAEFGVDVTLIHAGEFKVEGNMFEPLSDEARAELQRGVDEAHDMFIAAVARNRGVDEKTVREKYGRGRVLSAQRAVELGMADGVATLDEVIAEAAKRAGVPAVSAVEGRRVPAADVEVRALAGAVAAEGGEWPLVGDGVPYGRESANLGTDARPWREVFLPGAFSRSVANDDLRVIWQHDPAYVLGRTPRTARVWEEDGVVRYAARPPEAQWARDAMESIRRGDVDRSSFGFRVPRGGAKWEARDGYDLRIVSEAQLVELGPQTFAAYEHTSVAVREHAAWREQRARVGDAELMRRLKAMEMSL